MHEIEYNIRERKEIMSIKKFKNEEFSFTHERTSSLRPFSSMSIAKHSQCSVIFLSQDVIFNIIFFMMFETSSEQFDKSCKSVLYVADFIWNLIEKKQLIEAVRLICPFKLIDKFHPVPLLKEFVENAKRLCIQNSKRSKSLDVKVPCNFFRHPISLP